MSPLLAPLLAQLIDLKVTDRTEARYVKYGASRLEGSTNPKVTVSARERHFTSALSYGPRLSLVPLERAPRTVFVFHEASAGVSYQLKRSSIAFNSAAGYGKLNLRFYGLQGPGTAPTNTTTPDGSMTTGNGNMQPPPATTPNGGATPTDGTGAPGTATTRQTQVVDRNVDYYTIANGVTLTHRPSQSVDLGVYAGHNAAGGLSDEARLYYPSLYAFSVGARATDVYQLSKRDSFSTSAFFLQSWSSTGNRTGNWAATEVWRHRYDKNTSSSLGAGLNVTRFAQPDGTRGFSVFPNFQAGLAHQRLLARGTLSLSVSVYSAPALDPLRALVDPRVGGGLSLGFTQGRFFAGANSTVALSVAPANRNQGAVDSVQAQAMLGYQLGKAVTVDGGARFARQAYQGVTVLPSTWAAFVGVTVGLDARFKGR